VSGTEGFSLIVTISGGQQAKIMHGMIIFKNEKSSYEISGVPDNVKGISYRSAPKGFMNQFIMAKYLLHSRLWGHDAAHVVIWCDNYGSHLKQIDLARSVNKELKFFPTNATDKVQPCDSFLIQLIKTIWGRKWLEYVLNVIKSKNMSTSGKIPNPQKHWYLRTMAETLKEANEKMYDNRTVNAARKAMIQCGLDVPDDGVWKVEMLTKQLQRIIQQYGVYFEGNITPKQAEKQLAASKKPNEKESREEEEKEPNEKESREEEEKDGIEMSEIVIAGIRGLSDSVPINVIEKYFAVLDNSTGADDDRQKATTMMTTKRKNRADGDLDDHNFGDDMSLEEFRKRWREMIPEPFVLSFLPDAIETRSQHAESMREDLTRDLAEVHSLNVGRLFRVVLIAARREGVSFLQYEAIDPMTMRAISLADIPFKSKSIAIQVVHTPFHFTTIVMTSKHINQQQLDSSDEDEGYGAIYMNSLCHDLQSPSPIAVQNINSPLVQDLAAGHCEKFLNFPCLEQPYGNACGMACNLNAALALQVGNFEGLHTGGFEETLEKFKFPTRRSWSNSDFCIASNVLIDMYERGLEGIPKLSLILEEMSSRIEAKHQEVLDEKKAERLKKKEQREKQKKNKQKQQKPGALHPFFQQSQISKPAKRIRDEAGDDKESSAKKPKQAKKKPEQAKNQSKKPENAKSQEAKKRKNAEKPNSESPQEEVQEVRRSKRNRK
jgi:hypothetical protein